VTFASLLPPSTPPSFPSCRNQHSATQVTITKIVYTQSLHTLGLDSFALFLVLPLSSPSLRKRDHWRQHHKPPSPLYRSHSCTDETVKDLKCQSDNWISALLRRGKNYIGFELFSSWMSVTGRLPPAPTIRLSSS
jgi:hypothetical protein